MRFSLLLIGVAFLALPGVAGAQIYKCPGPGGAIQYSQSRTSASCTEMNQAAPSHMGGDDSGAVRKYLDQVDQQAADKKQKQAEAAKDAELKQQACAIARSRAAMLNQSGRMFTVDENGNRSYMNDEQFDQQRQQVNAAVEQLCN